MDWIYGIYGDKVLVASRGIYYVLLWMNIKCVFWINIKSISINLIGGYYECNLCIHFQQICSECKDK